MPITLLSHQQPFSCSNFTRFSIGENQVQGTHTHKKNPTKKKKKNLKRCSMIYNS